MCDSNRNLNRAACRVAIDSHLPFSNSTGSLEGVTLVHPHVHPGRLNDTEQARLRGDLTTPGIDYIVFSYGTPIAWVTKDGERYRVSQKFSQTTSQHMGLTSGM